MCHNALNIDVLVFTWAPELEEDVLGGPEHALSAPKRTIH